MIDKLTKPVNLFGFNVPAVGLLAAGAVLLLLILSRRGGSGSGTAASNPPDQTPPGVTAEDLAALSDTIDGQLTGLQSDYAAQLAAVQAGFGSGDQAVLSQLSAFEADQQAALNQLSGNIPGMIDQRVSGLNGRVTALEQQTTKNRKLSKNVAVLLSRWLPTVVAYTPALGQTTANSIRNDTTNAILPFSGSLTDFEF